MDSGKGPELGKANLGDKCLGMLEVVGEVFPEANTSASRFIFTGMYSQLCPNPR